MTTTLHVTMSDKQNVQHKTWRPLSSTAWNHTVLSWQENNKTEDNYASETVLLKKMENMF